MPTKSFTELEVWKKAYALTLELYRAIAFFPKEERFRLSDQLMRASMSIPSNIAEGYGRRTPHDKTRFYVVASASCEELGCWLMMAADLGFLKRDSGFLPRIKEVARMLHGLINATLAGVYLGESERSTGADS